MEHQEVAGAIARRSARIYLSLSLGAALLFWLVAGFVGGYTLVAQIGGAIWIGLLTLIVTTPLVTSWVKGYESQMH